MPQACRIFLEKRRPAAPCRASRRVVRPPRSGSWRGGAVAGDGSLWGASVWRRPSRPGVAHGSGCAGRGLLPPASQVAELVAVHRCFPAACCVPATLRWPASACASAQRHIRRSEWRYAPVLPAACCVADRGFARVPYIIGCGLRGVCFGHAPRAARMPRVSGRRGLFGLCKAEKSRIFTSFKLPPERFIYIRCFNYICLRFSHKANRKGQGAGCSAPCPSVKIRHDRNSILLTTKHFYT